MNGWCIVITQKQDNGLWLQKEYNVYHNHNTVSTIINILLEMKKSFISKYYAPRRNIFATIYFKTYCKFKLSFDA